MIAHGRSTSLPALLSAALLLAACLPAAGQQPSPNPAPQPAPAPVPAPVPAPAPAPLQIDIPAQMPVYYLVSAKLTGPPIDDSVWDVLYAPDITRTIDGIKISPSEYVFTGPPGRYRVKTFVLAGGKLSQAAAVCEIYTPTPPPPGPEPPPPGPNPPPPNPTRGALWLTYVEAAETTPQAAAVRGELLAAAAAGGSMQARIAGLRCLIAGQQELTDRRLDAKAAAAGYPCLLIQELPAARPPAGPATAPIIAALSAPTMAAIDAKLKELGK